MFLYESRCKFIQSKIMDIFIGYSKKNRDVYIYRPVFKGEFKANTIFKYLK